MEKHTQGETPRTNEAAIGFARILIEKGTPENPKFECTEIIPADFARQLERELSTARARIEVLEADAARYRWLRDNNEQHCDEELPYVSQHTQDDWGKWRDVFLSPEQLDAVIDTQLPARTALKGES